MLLNSERKMFEEANILLVEGPRRRPTKGGVAAQSGITFIVNKRCRREWGFRTFATARQKREKSGKRKKKKDFIIPSKFGSSFNEDKREAREQRNGGKEGRTSTTRGGKYEVERL